MTRHDNFRALVFAVVLAIGLPQPVKADEAGGAARWQAWIEEVPHGALLSVRFHDGTHLKGTLVQTTTDAFVLARRSGGQVMTSTIRYQAVQVIQKANNWKPKGKIMWIVVGIAISVVVILLITHPPTDSV